VPIKQLSSQKLRYCLIGLTGAASSKATTGHSTLIQKISKGFHENINTFFMYHSVTPFWV
jgi:hypothetical protein